MRVSVNGEPRELEPGMTLQALLQQVGVTSPRVAVAVNAAVVPRHELASRTLAEGDSVDIIEAVGGG